MYVIKIGNFPSCVYEEIDFSTRLWVIFIIQKTACLRYIKKKNSCFGMCAKKLFFPLERRILEASFYIFSEKCQNIQKYGILL